MRKSYLSLLVAVVVLFASHIACPAYAAKVGFVVNKKGLWQRQVDGKNVGNPIESGPKEQENGLDVRGPSIFFNAMGQSDAGTVYWLAVTSDNNAEKAGECGPEGVHFYNANTGNYYFLPIGDGGEFSFQSLVFSPFLDKFILNRDSSSQVFTFPDLVVKMDKQVFGRATMLDDSRIIFATPEPDLGKGDREGLAMSVMIFDLATGKAEVLKKATATSFFLLGIWEPGMITDEEHIVLNGANINITEISVKSPKDWKDYPDKTTAKVLSIPVP